MEQQFPPISFCIGVYNEESILLDNLRKLQDGLDRLLGKGKYEIVVVDNGSSDNTVKLLKSIGDPNIKSVFIKKKGLGLALRNALLVAKNDYILFSAIDLPFGFSDLEGFQLYWNKYDIIFGSKAHPQSVVFIPLKRRIISFLYRTLLQVLFSVRIRDTQGSIFFRKEKILPFLDFCDSETAFFTTQLAIYSELYGLRWKEISVKMKQEKTRPSKIHLVKDASRMFSEVLREFLVYRRVKRSV